MIPDGWSEHFLGDVCKISSGVGFPLKYQGRKDLPIPFIKVSDMNSEGNEKYVCSANNTIDNQIQEYIKAPIFSKGCLVLPKVGAALLTNKRRILAQPTAVDNNVMVLMSKYVNYEFLYYWSLLIDMADYVQSGALPSINKSTISQIKITLPPEKEQKKIVAILSSVDDAIQATQAVIDQTRTVKQGLMQQLLTRGIGHTRFKQTEIGEIPIDWNISTIGQVCKVTSGGTPSRNQPEFWNGNVPWVKTGEINYSKIFDTSEKITKDGILNSSAKLVPNGSLLMAMYGQGKTRGKVALLGIDATINQACLAILQGKYLCNEFLYYFLTREYINLRSLSHEGSQKNLNAALVKQVIIPIPPTSEQNQIVKILNSVDSRIDAEKAILISFQKLKHGLMQDLLTGRMRVGAPT